LMNDSRHSVMNVPKRHSREETASGWEAWFRTF